MQRRLFPNIPALLAFDAVARTGSFTAAAQDLDLTQGAVSRQVAQLEAQLGVSLIDRRARRAELNVAGKAYASKIRAALDLLGQGALEAMGQTQERSLRLAMLPTFGTRWLMPRIPRFVRRHPDITLHFATRIGQFSFDAQGIDAAIYSGRGDWPGAQLTLLMSEQVLPVCAPDLVTKPLASLPLLALQSRPTAWADWWRGTQRAGAVPTPSMRFEQLATLAQATVAGMGVALMPAFLIRAELDQGALVAIGDEVPSGFGYYFAEPEGRSGTARLKAVEEFRDWLITETDRETVV